MKSRLRRDTSRRRRWILRLWVDGVEGRLEVHCRPECVRVGWSKVEFSEGSSWSVRATVKKDRDWSGDPSQKSRSPWILLIRAVLISISIMS